MQVDVSFLVSELGPHCRARVSAGDVPEDSNDTPVTEYIRPKCRIAADRYRPGVSVGETRPSQCLQLLVAVIQCRL